MWMLKKIYFTQKYCNKNEVMLEITHKQKMLKLHNLNSNYGITKILQIANAKKILYKKQTPTIVNAKKFYTETNSYNS